MKVHFVLIKNLVFNKKIREFFINFYKSLYKIYKSFYNLKTDLYLDT